MTNTDPQAAPLKAEQEKIAVLQKILKYARAAEKEQDPSPNPSRHGA